MPIFAIRLFVFPRDEIAGALPAPVPLICAQPAAWPILTHKALIFGRACVSFSQALECTGVIVKKRWRNAFAGCVTLTIAWTSAASAQSSVTLDFGPGKPAPPGDATMGQNMFTAICWACHSSDLSGYKGPPLTGPSFYKIWQGRRVDALTDLIRNTMPKDDPGMSERAARDVVAYIVTYANRPESLKNGK